jgi:site-specific DNA-cytosine methylase
MIVLSLFDGMSCGQIALNRAGIKYEKYYASEIDKYAIKVTQSNYSDTIQLGSITDWQKWDIEKPDLIIGGSPCQGFSFAGKQLNFNDDRSKLFFTFVDILKHYKPKYFLLENVVMKKEYNDVISGLLGELYPECVTNGELFRTGRLEPIQINSALVSAQNRKRLYWTNIQGIEQPQDKGILLKDIIEAGDTEKEKAYCIDANYSKGANKKSYTEKCRRQLIKNSRSGDDKSLALTTNANMTGSGVTIYKCGAILGRNPENPKIRKSGLSTEQMLEVRQDEKTNCLTSVQKDNVLCRHVGNADIKGNDAIKRVYGVDSKSPCLTTMRGGHQEPKISEDFKTWRKLTPVECERLQTVPDNYTNYVSNSQRYKMLGNGWTVDVIAHILKNIV